jgi:DNA-binding CsgD family transcriptional regulator
VDLEQRVRRLAAEGGDLSTVRADLDRLMRAHVPYDVASIGTVDPATMLWTSCFVSGLPPGGEREREQVLFELEWADADLNGYAELANTGRLVGRLHEATGGDLSRAKRWEPLLAPYCSDEMRVILRSRELTWGTLSLYRFHPSPPFDERDERAMRTAGGAIADLFRLTMLRAALDMPAGIDRPPGVILTSTDGGVEATDEAARAWLEGIDDRDRVPSAVRSVSTAAASGNGLARAALPTPRGQWVVLHASRIDGDRATVAIVIEGARPIIVSEVIAGAYGLTPREREVTGLAAQGLSTKQIAARLRISPFTVQDHLKAVFAKIGVQSRAELVATLYVQHYEPRHQADAMPSPYGWYLDDHLLAVS